jgi:hypothetical protein
MQDIEQKLKKLAEERLGMETELLQINKWLIEESGAGL